MVNLSARPSGRHPEVHRSDRTQWLRAGVLGANDGLLSTGALLLGVASASGSRSAVLTAGIAAVVAGALSMAVGEYSSVSSQRDTERADLDREQAELADEPEAERAELARIYRRRGLSPELAQQVADELSLQDDLLAVHARDELGLDPEELARPVQAALVSAVSFAAGAIPPVLMVAVLPTSMRVMATVLLTLVGLMILGAVGASFGGAPRGRAALRVGIGGALALAASAAIGALVGTVV